MTDILFRRETADEQLAMGATHLDDLDLVPSKVDGRLCMVSIKNGRQVCQQCGNGFDESHPKLKRTEVSLAPGSPPVILHVKCENPKMGTVQRIFRGFEIRRKMARAARESASIEKAAADNDKKSLVSR